MKNPRVASTQLRESGAHSLTLASETKDGVSTIGGGLTGGKSDSAQDSKNDDFKGLVKFLRALKFTEEEIGRITELVATVAAVASVVGWA